MERLDCEKDKTVSNLRDSENHAELTEHAMFLKSPAQNAQVDS